ncbi:MAG: hypothetical protein HY868_11400 [Chloroflexi bacterium]|nr:hypothetical protein [Chloroflexota bacterium]
MELAEALRRKIERDVEQAQTFYPITPIRNANGMICRLQLEMSGAIGAGNPARMHYALLITLDGYPFVCPRAWVEKPDDAFIFHMQIWQPRPPLNLPEVCTSAELAYQKDWTARRIAPGERTILGFLRQVLFMLNNENTHSKARP